jgi:hypothetical protein
MSEKLFKAMETDEKQKQEIKTKLLQARDRPLQIKIARPGMDDIVIPCRRLRGAELLNMTRDFNEINPKLTTGNELEMTLLTPDENQRAYEVMDRYIALATGIEQEWLTRELDDVRVRRALLKGIIDGSSLNPEDKDALTKFRRGS